ncbi:MAG: hypothetical protein SGILL_000723 [Bacillariaceae sp.]
MSPPISLVVLCIAFAALLSPATASFASFFVEDDAEVLAQREPIRGTTNLALLPASPDCWLDALQALKIQTGSEWEEKFYDTSSEDDGHALNSLTCSWLSSVDQKVLALELSKCHMKDLGRPLFLFEEFEGNQECSRVLQDYGKVQGKMTQKHQSKLSREISTICLSRLTDNGVNTYTHFFSYVNSLCTRLLSQYILGQYYETSHHLARSSAVAEEKIQRIIEQQDEIFRAWNEREQHVMGMYDELEVRVEKQTDGLESKIAILHRKLEEEHKHWKDEYGAYKEMLKEELAKHQKEFAIFSGAIRKIQECISSWTSGIESLWQGVQVGHSLFRGIFLYVGSLFCTYLLTLPRPFRWMRGVMAMLVVIGLLVEVSILYTTRPGQENGSYWRDAYVQQCETLRGWLFALLYTYFVVGVVRSAIYGCRKGQKEEEILHTIDVDAPTIDNKETPGQAHQPNMQTLASQNQRQAIGQSAFQPPSLFPFSSGRAHSKDGSAEVTDVSPDSTEQRSMAPPTLLLNHAGVTPYYGIYNPYFPPQAAMAHQYPGTFAPLANSASGSRPQVHNTQRIQNSTVDSSLNRMGTLSPQDGSNSPQNQAGASENTGATGSGMHMEGDEAMESGKKKNDDAVQMDAGVHDSKKRPISDVAEDEKEEENKRARYEEEIDKEDDSDMEEDASSMEEGIQNDQDIDM